MFIKIALKKSFIILVKSLNEACALANAYAPEHLEIMTNENNKALGKITNAGAIFIGPYSPVPAGDYAAGSNHTLPTSGFAKMYSPLGVESFGKMVYVQALTKSGLRNLEPTVAALALSEGLPAHKQALTIRNL